MDKVRWGIVGAGRIAHTFAKDMADTEHGVLQAVAARGRASAETFAASYDIPTAHEGYEALYADPEVDAVYVATPHTLHLGNSSDALRAGKAAARVLTGLPLLRTEKCSCAKDICPGGTLVSPTIRPA